MYDNKQYSLDNAINNIKNILGGSEELIVRNFIVGKKNHIEVAIIYINGLINKDMVDRDILKPLMLHVDEDLIGIKNIEEYILKKYIAVSNTIIETDINRGADAIKRGKTVIAIDGCSNLIVVDTVGGVYRSIAEPENDISLRGPREGFIENLETNISMIKRKIKDKNLKTQKFTIGRRSQTDLVIMYIDDIVDKNYLNNLVNKIKNIDVDSAWGNSFIEQVIEEHSFSIFPQIMGTERPDVAQAALLEGRIIFLMGGAPYVTMYPTIFFQFFQTSEDYYGRSIVSSFSRIIRILAIIIIITLPSMFIVFVKFNSELVPIEYVESLIQSRQGIALSPFMSLLSMDITIEFLREGGIKLPSKVGQTLSVVGGIIIGDAAIQSKVVSSSTLLVAGVTTVATFVIPNYQMSISIRLISYVLLILSNWLGMLGIAVGWFFIIAYLCSLENLGVPYLSFHKSDMKDIFIRAPIWKMKKRPEAIPHNDPIRQSDYRRKNEQNSN